MFSDAVITQQSRLCSQTVALSFKDLRSQETVTLEERVSNIIPIILVGKRGTDN